MLSTKTKHNKAAISFSSYTPKEFLSPQNRNYEGQLSSQSLSKKGQLFIITSTTNRNIENRASESSIAENILKEVYYSYPSDDIASCLKHAFHDANTLINELLNEMGKKHQFGVKCTALVLTNERGYIAQVGDNHIYRVTKDKLERLTSDNILVGGQESFALGLESKINIHFNRYIALRSGDFYLLSTDGLAKVNHHLIRRIVLGNTPRDACRKVTEILQDKEQTGKITVQVVQVNFTPGQPIRPKQGVFNSRALALVLLLLMLSVTLVFYDKKKDSSNEDIKQPQLIQINDETLIENAEPTREPIVSGTSELTQSEPIQQTVTEEKKANFKPNEPQNFVTANRARPRPRASSPPVAASLSDQWNLKNLRKFDYEIKDDKITFLATRNIKKALYRTTKLKNFNIQMEARIKKNSAAGRFGVIVGYNAMEISPYEIYYLLSLFRQKELLLQKYSGFRKDVVTRIPINFDSSQKGFQDIQFEIKCSGPFIELHADQKQVFRWRTAEEFISGQVGVFVSPDTEVEVSKFTVVKRDELTQK